MNIVKNVEDFLIELKDKISQCSSLPQLLLILDHYLKKIEDFGCSNVCLENTIKKIDIIAKSLARLCSCRFDLVDRIVKKDPRLTTIDKNMRIIIELLQQECGQQTSIGSQEIEPIQTIMQSQVAGTKNIGKYEVIKLLGEGGMGIVWLAKDPIRSNLVAIKEPKISGNIVKDEINIKKIAVEAEVLKNLDHPNIVKFIDFFVELGKPYLVMEYVEGMDIEKRMNEMSISEKDAINIIRKVSNAVDHMHERNVVHRDLKPKNIYSLHSDPYDVKILDFGTAKFFHSQLEKGEAIFSPGGYTPPEQLKFMYSPQGDIWSLGGLLFYLLTKQHPVVVMPDYPNVKEPPRVEKILKDVDPHIIRAIKKAMDPDPVKRYIKASDFIKEILGEKDLVERSTKPKLLILGMEIPIDTRRVVIGRLHHEMEESLEKESKKVITFIEKDNLYIYVHDPRSYISRLHVEIVYRDGYWYLRDLGSLNKTAVLEEGKWRIVHASYKVPSRHVRLANRSLISLGYDDKLGPYLVITFISGVENEIE